MDEQVKLAKGTTLVIIPMGIDVSDTSLVLEVNSELTYDQLEAELLDDSNIGVIELLHNGEVVRRFTNCVSLKSLTKDLEKGTYVIVLNADQVSADIKTLKTNIDNLNSLLTEEEKVSTELDIDYRLSSLELGV